MSDAQISVRVEREGPVTTIIMCRPERRNAVDGPMASELRKAFRDFEADESQKVAVLWGEGGVFCAGADLKSVNDPSRVHEFDMEGGGDGPMGPSRIALSKPVIAAVAGYAVAGGLELALLADLRVAEEGATFGVFCRRWGVPLIDGGTVRLPRLVGMGRALDMILTGRPVGADEALAMGLANRVVPNGQSRAVAESWAERSHLSPKRACAPTAAPPTNNGICRSPTRYAKKAAWARRSSPPRARPGLCGLNKARGGMGGLASSERA